MLLTLFHLFSENLSVEKEKQEVKKNSPVITTDLSAATNQNAAPITISTTTPTPDTENIPTPIVTVPDVLSTDESASTSKTVEV